MRLLANCLTISRYFLGIAILLLAIKNYWFFAWLFIVIAITTDIFDGEIARLDKNPPKEEWFLDYSADFIFSVGVIGGLFLSHHLTGLVVLVILIGFLIMKILEFLFPKGSFWQKLGISIKPFYYIIVVFVFLIIYTKMAFINNSLPVIFLEFFILALLAYIKRNRISKWLGLTTH